MVEADISQLLYGLMTGLGAGAIGGTLAGLAGVGGGLLYVPIFFALMPSDAGGIAMPVFASLVAVAMTGFFSARSHWRLGHVDRSALIQLLPGLLIGAGIGLWSTLRLSEIWILLALAALDGWIAFDYGRQPKKRTVNGLPLALFSGPIGFISGALGIGGGTMLVPLLRRSCELRFAVGTSATCGAAMALCAVAANTLFEQGWHTLLAAHASWVTGAWLGILLILPVATSWSAALHAQLSESTLRIVLKGIFISLAGLLLLAAVTLYSQS